MWDGRYFVTLGLPNGKVVRRDAARSPPRGPVTILATDNGMQGKEWVREMLRHLRAQWKG